MGRSILIKYLNESYSILETDDINIKQLVVDELSVFVPNYQFQPLFRAKQWDGRERLYRVNENGNIVFPKGFERRIAELVNCQLPTPNTIVTREVLVKFIETLGLPFEPRYFQIDAALSAINEKRLTILLPTSSGKSLVIYIFFRFMLAYKKRCVLIVPSVMLVNQMYADFKDYGLKDIDAHVHLISAGKCKHFDKMFTITTWQSIYKSTELFHDIDCVLVDEAHGITGDSIKNIVISAKNTTWRIGLTGTEPSEHLNKMHLEGCIGKAKRFLTTKKLIDLGLATPIDIVCVFLKYNLEDCKKISKMKYQDEVKALNDHDGRRRFISKLSVSLAKKGNTLCLFTKITDHGIKLVDDTIKIRTGKQNAAFVLNCTKNNLDEALESNEDVYINEKIDRAKIEKLLKGTRHNNAVNRIHSLEELEIFVITGAVDAKQREYVRLILENHDNAVVFASYATMSTGVNIKKLHNAILAESFKSDIRLLQTIGRTLRLHDSKAKVFVFDIIDDCQYKTHKNYCLKHFNERFRNYQEQEFDVIEQNIVLK